MIERVTAFKTPSGGLYESAEDAKLSAVVKKFNDMYYRPAAGGYGLYVDLQIMKNVLKWMREEGVA